LAIAEVQARTFAPDEMKQIWEEKGGGLPHQGLEKLIGPFVEFAIFPVKSARHARWRSIV
jgi:hypothetical protein